MDRWVAPGPLGACASVLRVRVSVCESAVRVYGCSCVLVVVFLCVCVCVGKPCAESSHVLDAHAPTHPCTTQAHYVHMNAEIEAQAKALLSEAEAVISGQHNSHGYLDSNDMSTMDDDDDTDATIDLGHVGLPSSMTSPGPLGDGSGAGAAVLTDAEGTPTRPRTGDAAADSEVEQFLLALEGVGEEAALRLIKAQLRTIQGELQATQTELRNTKTRAAAAEKAAKQAVAEKAKLDKALQASKSGAAKHAAVAEAAEKRGTTADAQLKGLQKELDDLRRAQKKNDSKSSTLQVRLNRAQEDLETARKEVSRLKQATSSTGGELRGKYDATLKQNKVLAAQKEELLAAFKKQQQLIDILKRQKLHVEAARLLQFSEEEFVKALDWGK